MILVKMVIDGKEIEAEAGATILDAAKKLGTEMPTLCYYPGVFAEPPADFVW